MSMSLIIYDTLPIRKAEPEPSENETSESEIPKVPKQYSQGVDVFHKYAEDPRVRGMHLFITPERELYGLGTEPREDGGLNRVLWRFGKGDMGRGMMKVLTVPDEIFDTRIEDIGDNTSLLQSAIPTWFQARDYDKDNFSGLEGFEPDTKGENGEIIPGGVTNEYYGRVYSRPVVEVGYDYSAKRLDDLLRAIRTNTYPEYFSGRRDASLPQYEDGLLIPTSRQRIAGAERSPILDFVDTEGLPTQGQNILGTLPEISVSDKKYVTPDNEEIKFGQAMEKMQKETGHKKYENTKKEEGEEEEEEKKKGNKKKTKEEDKGGSTESEKYSKKRKEERMKDAFGDSSLPLWQLSPDNLDEDGADEEDWRDKYDEL